MKWMHICEREPKQCEVTCVLKNCVTSGVVYGYSDRLSISKMGGRFWYSETLSLDHAVKPVTRRFICCGNHSPFGKLMQSDIEFTCETAMFTATTWQQIYEQPNAISNNSIFRPRPH